MASLDRPDGYKPRIMEIRLSRETVPGIAVSLVKGELILQGFQIVRAAGDTTLSRHLGGRAIGADRSPLRKD
jgi:hypothetical protein